MSNRVTGVRKILVINLAFIGDVILSTPVTAALHNRFPEAQLDILVIPVAAAVACLNPYIDNVFVYDKRGKHKKLRQLWQLIKELRREQYDLTVSTNFSLRSSLVGWITGARYRVGYDAQQAKWFLTHIATPKREVIQHEAANALAVLQPLGISGGDTKLVLKLTDEDVKAVKPLVRKDSARKIAVLCPAGSYEKKSWSTAGYAGLIKRFAGQVDWYLIGGQKEKDYLEMINNQAGNAAQILGGTLTLGQTAALIAAADVLVTVDTGPLHIAQAVETPVLALFGPTDPAAWGPRGASDRVIYHPTSCAPCWGKGLCPEQSCMQQICLDEVIAELQAMLGFASN